jgi:hypothetical protein
METSPAPWIEALRHSHDRLRAVAAPLGLSQLQRPSYAAKWSIAQVLSHLGSQAVLAVAADPALPGLPDDQILAHATATGRALVTANIKDIMPLDAQYRAASQAHAGLIFLSAKTFRQDRAYTAAITGALSTFLDQETGLQPGQVIFLPRQ